MKKIKLLTVLFVILGFISPTYGIDFKKKSATTKASDSVGLAEAEKSGAGTSGSGNLSSCDPDAERFKDNIPLNALHMLMGISKDEDPFEIISTPKGTPTKMTVKIKPFLKNCVDIKAIDHYTSKDTNNIAISLKNTYDYTHDLKGLTDKACDVNKKEKDSVDAAKKAVTAERPNLEKKLVSAKETLEKAQKARSEVEPDGVDEAQVAVDAAKVTVDQLEGEIKSIDSRYEAAKAALKDATENKTPEEQKITYLCSNGIKTGQVTPSDISEIPMRTKIDLCLLGKVDTVTKSPLATVDDEGNVVLTKKGEEWATNEKSYEVKKPFDISLIDDDKNVKYDANKPVKILFARTRKDTDRVTFGESASKIMDQYSNCLSYEEITQSERGVFLVSPEEAAISGVEKICANGTSADIEREATKIGNRVGNYKGLNDNLQKLLVKILNDAQKTKEEVERSEKIAELYDELRDFKDEACGDSTLKASDRDAVADCAVEYLATLNTLKIYIDQDKEELKKLYDTYSKSSSRKKEYAAWKLAYTGDLTKEKDLKKQFDKEYYAKVEVLRDRIGKFSKDKSVFSYRKIMDNFEKFALTDAADTTAEFLLNSAEYGKVNPVSYDGNRKYSYDSADKTIEKNLKRYKREISQPKGELFESGTGVAKHSSKYRSQARDLEKSRKNWYQNSVVKNEQKWASYCQNWFGFQRNPSKCQQGQREYGKRMQRYQAINGKYQQEIGRYSGLYSRLSSVESEYARRNPANEDGGDGYFNSFTLFNTDSTSFFGDDVGGDFTDHGSFRSGPGTFQDPWSSQMSMNGPNPYNYNNQQQYNQNMNGNINYRQPQGSLPGNQSFMPI